ncbi:BatA domain-containing protein [Paraglaciecola chathamensis]|uniref:BatA domain-containing protein n=1 Tax=Paraglaciecola chathamensis TaxID=368405 RepID=UPI0026F90D8A|nr:BatA domain-containing protein [Paraglaciecola chathamensis]MDO6557831.1 BatA domain-containing protein [Paraglaciecola chathamensis]
MGAMFSALNNIVLSPLWLLGMLAVIIPLAIHFFSKSKAPLISFAQYALIPSKQSSVPNALRLSQWLLLLLRMMIIVLLSLALAQCMKQPTDNSQTRYFLVSQDWLHHANEYEKQSLLETYNQAQDATSSRLIVLGANASKYLNNSLSHSPGKNPSKNINANLSNEQPEALSEYAINGSNKLTLDTLAQITAANEKTGLNAQINTARPLPQTTIWQQVADFIATHPTVSPSQVQIFTSNGFSQFNNDKINLPETLNWHISSPESSSLMGEKSKILMLTSAKNHAQTQYLTAAFDALDRELNRELSVDHLPASSPMSLEQLKPYDWVFYLADEKLSTQQAQTPAPVSEQASAQKRMLNQYVQQGGNLFITANQQVGSTGKHSVFITQSGLRYNEITIRKIGALAKVAEKITSSKDEVPTSTHYQVIWQTSDQQPLLTRTIATPTEATANHVAEQWRITGQILEFHSRFEPSWTNWVSQLDFPYTLDALMNESRYQQTYEARATVHAAQIARGAPTKSAKANSNNQAQQRGENEPVQSLVPSLNPQRDDQTHYWLLTLLVCAFCLERMASEYSARTKSAGAT